MHITRYWQAYLLCCLVLIPGLLYQNCSGVSSIERSVDPIIVKEAEDSRFCLAKTLKKTELQPAVLTEGLQYEISTANGQTLGKEILVMADNKCLRAISNRTSLTQNFSPELLNQIQNYSTTKVILQQNLTLAQLQEMANLDICVELLDIYAELEILNCENCGSTPNDTLYNTQEHLTNIKHHESLPLFYNTINGIDTKDPLVRVAVLDTGIDLQHEDLVSRMALDLYGMNMGYNGITNSNLLSDVHTHGTHVAGLIGAASHNEQGVTGVMGNSLELIPALVSNDPQGRSVSMDAVINSLLWSSEVGVDVINMSLGGGRNGNMQFPQMEALRVAMEMAVKSGAFIVSAAGNNGYIFGQSVNFGTTGGGIGPFHMYPAMHSRGLAGAITVGSINAIDLNKSSFSNYHPLEVDIFAPGAESSGVGLLATGSSLDTGKYVRKSGTSMATPVVAGAAALSIALLKSRGIHPLPEQIEKILEQGSPSRESYRNFVKEGRHLDLKYLVEFINNDLNVTPNTSRDDIAGRVSIANFSSITSPNLRSGEAMNLQVELNEDSSLAVEYKWFKNNIRQEPYRHPNFIKNFVSPNDAGTYHVEITSGKTKVISEKIKITIDGNSDGDPIEEATNCEPK